MPQPIIEIKKLDITYNPGKENEYKATKKCDMEIYPGEYIAFFGPSGCGKSTLFYCILGILAPSAGELLVKGENPYSYTPEKMVKFQTSTIGIIYQAFYLINSLSVADNISLPMTFHSTDPLRRRARALELLKRLDIEEQADKYPDNLSGGQCQRVSVARAMVNNPEIILADEPTGNLDSTATKQVMNSLEEINNVDKKTVIIITHNAAQLVYAHRVFYMKDGRVLRVAPNPDKKQIAKYDKQKNIVTELDYLSKLFPYNNQRDLKVKSLVNYLTQDFSFEQLTRLEQIVNLMVERKIDEKSFAKILVKKYADGGIDASQSLAEVMGEKINKILDESNDVLRYRRRLRENMFFSKERTLVNRITSYIINDHKNEMTPLQLRILKDAVYQRVSGVTRQENFLDTLLRSVEDRGLGLNKKLAVAITRYFEKLLIQGVEEIVYGEEIKFKDAKAEWVSRYLKKSGKNDEPKKDGEKKDEQAAWTEKYLTKK